MRRRSRVGWAVAASVGLHALLALATVMLVRRNPEPAPQSRPQIDTRITFAAERTPEPPGPVVSTPIAEPTPPDPLPPAPPPDPPTAPPSPPVQLPPVVRSVAVPQTLSPELLARVREFAPSPALVADPGVQPAAAAIPARPASRPVHGALAAGQRVVYLLDASGSMGEWGKFDAARDAVAATAALQPAAVDVKVVVYAVTADVVTQASLATHTPAGRGDHVAGLRTAFGCSPDYVVWLTDSDDLPAAAVRTLVRRAGKPVTVVVARVGPDGVRPPAELR
jgi:hypothetical protein